MHAVAQLTSARKAQWQLRPEKVVTDEKGLCHTRYRSKEQTGAFMEVWGESCWSLERAGKGHVESWL